MKVKDLKFYDKNINKTEYRKIYDGYNFFLQYKKKYKFLFIKWCTWEYILFPYYDKVWGRLLADATDNYVCSSNTNLNNFVRRWVYIKKYYKYSEKKQAELEKEANEYFKKIEKEKGKTEYFK